MKLSIRVVITFAVLFTIAFTSDAIFNDIVQDDAFAGEDAGDSFHTVTILSNPYAPGVANGTYHGMIVPALDAEDWYAFFADYGTTVSLRLRVHPLLCGPSFQTPESVTRVEALIVGPDGQTHATIPLDVPCPSNQGQASVHTNMSGIWRVAVRYVIEPAEEFPGPAPGTTGQQSATAISAPPIATTSSQGQESAWYEIELGCEPMCLS